MKPGKDSLGVKKLTCEHQFLDDKSQIQMKQMKTDYKLMRRPGRLIDRIISEDWTKKNKNNFDCFGALTSIALINSLQIIMCTEKACRA